MKIKDYLQKYGMTLQEFGDKLNVTPQAVRNYRDGRIPGDPETVRKIVRVTNGEVSYADLYEDSSAPGTAMAQ